MGPHKNKHIKLTLSTRLFLVRRRVRALGTNLVLHMHIFSASQHYFFSHVHFLMFCSSIEQALLCRHWHIDIVPMITSYTFKKNRKMNYMVTTTNNLHCNHPRHVVIVPHNCTQYLPIHFIVYFDKTSLIPRHHSFTKCSTKICWHIELHTSSLTQGLG